MKKLYTKEEVKEIIKRKERKKIAFRKAKIEKITVGLGCVLIGAIAPVILNGDATISLFTMPAGLALLAMPTKMYMN